ncbi:TRP protein for flagellar function [Dunaliella salina]|uniref:TRP protein for flagellar function n=1 Tax=Dunaliella salina TaxID=3046 RepID=A0ABQ7GV45_DUNSA|nr:TRP protein for flagellar function [Dunaliella salina]|eukprot:KAF5838486.1 TRP protein for flagellar function [Dunaliella salina]
MSVLEKGLNSVWLAQSRFRRRRFDDCIEICTKNLEVNPYDQAVWYLKCRALTLKNWIDDTEIEEQGLGDVLLDEHQTAQVARPGTSLARPGTGAQGGMSPAVRPMTSSGRPVTGFARPGTSSRTVSRVKPGMLPWRAPVVLSMGPVNHFQQWPWHLCRFVRLGTASILSEPGGPFINSEKVDIRKYVARPALTRALCDYMIYVDHNMRRALELCALATQAHNFEDWWWKSRLGKCYYHLGLMRDAERQFRSCLKNQEMVTPILELCKVLLRLDMPSAAIEQYNSALQAHPSDSSLLLGLARCHDELGDSEKALQFYKAVLYHEASNVEAIACLAAHHFYTDQPEVALRYYRRLLQMGVSNTELWTNLGLCCFYASQYDMCLGSFERALQLADDSTLADVWYNLSQVAIGIGDLNLAYQCLRCACAIDPSHVEATNNLGVLEHRSGGEEQARAYFSAGQASEGCSYEPYFNGALLSFKLGDLQEAFNQVTKSLELFPEHHESLELRKQLKAHFTML